tara:strand:- start:744 stop:881 length:138 start_codon:yes stop_codon:yes gene_type:complete
MKVVIEFHGDVDPSTLLDAGIEWGVEFSDEHRLYFDQNAVQVIEE